eukprot:5983090-Amphidinium_carterae.1
MRFFLCLTFKPHHCVPSHEVALESPLPQDAKQLLHQFWQLINTEATSLEAWVEACPEAAVTILVQIATEEERVNGHAAMM